MCSYETTTTENKDAVLKEALTDFYRERWLDRFIFSRRRKRGCEYDFILAIFRPYALRVLGNDAPDQAIVNLFNEFVEML